MNRKNKPWTTLDEAFLLRHYKHKGSHYCAAKLGRRPRGVQSQWWVIKKRTKPLGDPGTTPVAPDAYVPVALAKSETDLRAALHTLADALADYLGGAR